LKEKAPCLTEGRFEMSYFLAYHVLVPWHPGEHDLAVALKFIEATVFTTPFWCVVAVTPVVL
jgi:hypothetical protein